MATLKEKIRNAGMGVGLAGLLSMTGCETPEDRFITGLLLGGVAPYSSDPQAAQALGFAGSSLVGSANAEKGRAQINFNNPSYQPRTIEVQEVMEFDVGYWVDGKNGGALNKIVEPCEIVKTNKIYYPGQSAVVYFYNPAGNRLHPKVKLVLEDWDANKEYVNEGIVFPGDGLRFLIYEGSEEEISEVTRPMEKIEGVSVRTFAAKAYIEMGGILNNYQLLGVKPFYLIKQEKKDEDSQNKRYRQRKEGEI